MMAQFRRLADAMRRGTHRCTAWSAL